MNYDYEQWDENPDTAEMIGYDLRGCLTYNKSEYLTASNIKRVVAVYEGENETEDWRWIVERTNLFNDFVYIKAGCDYTGWDCQSWIHDEHTCLQAIDCLKFESDEEVRKSLHAQIMSGEIEQTWREKMDKEFGLNSEKNILEYMKENSIPSDNSGLPSLEELNKFMVSQFDQAKQEISNVRPVEAKFTKYLVELAAETVRERQKSYNSPVKNFADIAACWSAIIGKEITSEQVALMMIMMKCLRENFKHQDDNIIDIAGYAICLEQVVKAKSNA